jgi:hypothetical protein
MICSAVYRSKRAHIGVDTPVLEAGRMTIDPTAQISTNPSARVLDPMDSRSEVLFGLITAFTSSAP